MSGAFGGLMRTVSAPLGIGTVALDDGSQVKGFLCEAAGVGDSVDITGHGGWRGYLASLPTAVSE